MREQPRIAEQALRDCVRDEFGLLPISLEFLPRGKDYDAGLYRVLTEPGKDYLLKITSRPLYAPSCLIPRYLRDLGIMSVVAPIPTKHQSLWTKLVDWTVLVYPFIEGDTSLTGLTADHWKQVGIAFRQIHQARLALGDVSVRREDFRPAGYAGWARRYEAEQEYSEAEMTASGRALKASWMAHQSTIHSILSSLDNLAHELNARSLPYVICHADLHAANVIRDRVGRVFVVDWDEVMLAPKERDFIFVREPNAAGFWEGYGRTDIDWTALAYYRWERVMQDLIYCTQNVCLRDDLEQETKADIARSFDAILADTNGMMAAAREAELHIGARSQPDLSGAAA